MSGSGDAQPYSFLLVVERGFLPEAPFEIVVDGG